MNLWTINDISTMQATSTELRQEGNTIGFVPTMGFLHEGHLSLLDIARQKCDVLVMSIFVNPTQFGENEDMEEYPRNFDRDAQLGKDRGVDILFYPSADEMYTSNFATYVVTDNLAEKLCGASRPTHFRGVTTVVSKLFNIVRPDIAVFGQKDAQQAIIIKRLVEDLNFPVEIVTGPIVREQDGLALSSRNTYLSIDERKQATALYRGLQQAKKLVESGEVNSNIIVDEIRSILEAEPDIREDYIAIVDPVKLDPVDEINQDVLIAIAAFVGTTRLIDNIMIDINGTNTFKI